MAFKKGREGGYPDFSRLITILNATQLQQTNNPTYQVIKTLIDNANQVNELTITRLKAVEEEVTTLIPSTSNLANEDFITWSSEVVTLPNSRQLLAGSGISFDDSVANERTISSTSSSGIWMPLTDGVIPETQIVFDGFGSCIMVFVPQP